MGISFDEFRTRIIEDGIAAAKEDYNKPKDKAKMEGSVAGFQSCFNKNPEEIAKLLDLSHKNLQKAFIDVNEKKISNDEYWYIRCFNAEVEWVANCMSAILINQGLSPIIAPTARGIMKAAEILRG